MQAKERIFKFLVACVSVQVMRMAFIMIKLAINSTPSFKKETKICYTYWI